MQEEVKLKTHDSAQNNITLLAQGKSMENWETRHFFLEIGKPNIFLHVELKNSESPNILQVIFHKYVKKNTFYYFSFCDTLFSPLINAPIYDNIEYN